MPTGRSTRESSEQIRSSNIFCCPSPVKFGATLSICRTAILVDMESSFTGCLTSSIFQQCAIIVTSLCLVISSFSYTKIFLTLRHHQNEIQDRFQQPNQTNQLNIARYKKAVSTAIWLQLTLVACYLPCNLVAVLTSYSGLSSSLCYAWIYTSTLVCLNSSLNPILYCWKLEEVRQAVKDTIRQVPCLCFSS